MFVNTEAPIDTNTISRRPARPFSLAIRARTGRRRRGIAGFSRTLAIVTLQAKRTTSVGHEKKTFGSL